MLITNEKAGTVATVTDLGNHSINAGGANQSDFVFDYAEKQKSLQSNLAGHRQQFDYKLSVRQLTETEKLTRHRIFNRLLSYLENKEIKYKGQNLPSVFHPLTAKRLLETGWTQTDIDEAEDSICSDAEFLRETEVWRSVPRGAFAELKKQNLEHLIFEQKIVGIPNELLNALICSELARRFSGAELRLCNCFVQIRGSDLDGKPCVSWRIDIDENFARRGFFVPVTDRTGLIRGLRVFRYLDDARPFMLRARTEVKNRVKHYA